MRVLSSLRRAQHRPALVDPKVPPQLEPPPKPAVTHLPLPLLLYVSLLTLLALHSSNPYNSFL